MKQLQLKKMKKLQNNFNKVNKIKLICLKKLQKNKIQIYKFEKQENFKKFILNVYIRE